MIRVMLVDDEPFILEGLSVLIDWEKYDCMIVAKASNGEEAFEYLKQGNIDLVITDIKMPVMTGIELLQTAREEGLSSAYFVILSGYNDFQYAQTAIKYEALDYLLKPVSADSLIEVIEKVKNKKVAAHGGGLTDHEKKDKTESATALFKDELDGIILGIEHNDKDMINKNIDELFMKVGGDGTTLSPKALDVNKNYLVFRLLHLAVELDKSIDQEVVMMYISDNILMSGTEMGTILHLKQFASEYAGYLASLRGTVSKGVLHDIEKELDVNYAQNITLKDFAAKYYVNSSYLGQLFRKQYGMSFREYLNMVRINKAATMLIKTDEKIGCIAEEVGYHDTDYFINKFISIKGCTPSKYRKNGNGQTEE
ncbi:response regulator transcription factor [Butyrivibrio hungatei]|nr:response regulator [Butyrivibrio hungatei]